MSTRVAAAVERALDDRQREATERGGADPGRGRAGDGAGGTRGAAGQRYRRRGRLVEKGVLPVFRRQGRSAAGGHGTRCRDRRLLPASTRWPRRADRRTRSTRWIEGTLAQVADPHLISMSRAVVGQMSAEHRRAVGQTTSWDRCATLLVEPVAALGQRRCRARCRRGLPAHRRPRCAATSGPADQPGADDIAHLVRFCLRGCSASTGRRCADEGHRLPRVRTAGETCVLDRGARPHARARPGGGRVRAAAVNFPDVLFMSGRYQVKVPPPFTPGSEFAGEVIAVGDGVARYRLGDRVSGSVMVGAFAEQVLARRRVADARFPTVSTSPTPRRSASPTAPRTTRLRTVAAGADRTTGWWCWARPAVSVWPRSIWRSR